MLRASKAVSAANQEESACWLKTAAPAAAAAATRSERPGLPSDLGFKGKAGGLGCGERQ